VARCDPAAVLIEVIDNGRGLDPAALKRQAVARGLLTAGQVAQLAEDDVLRLICLPGFSLAPAVTATSGRGIGMDVVKTTVENFGGTLEIESTPGAGCRIRLRFPHLPGAEVGHAL